MNQQTQTKDTSTEAINNALDGVREVDRTTEVVESKSAVISRNEIAQMIEAAIKYPRNIKTFRDEVLTLACLNQEVAEECTYALPRKERQRDGTTREVTIIGPSARFAEICVSAWGRCSVAARVVEDKGNFIVAQGVFMDHQKITRVVFEVDRRITTREGRRFSDDMVTVTANAACSIALRNAVFKGIPKAFWADLWMKSRQVAIGDATTLEARRTNALAKLQKMGASEEMVLAKLERQSAAEITVDDLEVLFGAFHAIKEGDATVEELFWPKNDAAAIDAAKQTSGVSDLKQRLAANKKDKPDKGSGDAVVFDQPSFEAEVDKATTNDALELLLDRTRSLPDDVRKAMGERIAKRANEIANAKKGAKK